MRRSAIAAAALLAFSFTAGCGGSRLQSAYDKCDQREDTDMSVVDS